MSQLRLSYHPEDEHHGELRAAAEVLGFRGHGAAWFNRSVLEEFARELGLYPIPQGDRIVLRGGEGLGAEESPVSVCLGLSISAFGRLGSLRVDVELAYTAQASGLSDLPLRASLAFLTTYADLEAFSRGVAAMLDHGGEAVLMGHDNG